MIEDTFFPANIVTRKKKGPEKKPSAPPPKKQPPPKKPMKKKQSPPPQLEDAPKEKSELEKLTGRTAKEIPHLNEEVNIDEDNEELLDSDNDEEDEDGPYSDKFVCNCEGLEAFRVKSIELPKMIFMRHKDGQSIKEKSSFMIYFYSALTMTNDDGRALYPYKSLMETCKKNSINLSIDWLDAEGKKNCTWKFGGARVQGLDLGSAAYERPEIAEAAIEISYDTINIDGIEF